MIQVSYPGVYVNEVPSGVRTIVGVSTSVAAFVDFFTKGPMNTSVKIRGLNDFERVFGGLNSQSESSYAITQFFLNGGTEAWVIRTAEEGTYATASCTMKATPGGATKVLEISAANPGNWGNNLRVRVLPISGSTTTFDLTVTLYESQSGTAKALASEKFVGLSIDSNDGKAVEKVVNNQSQLIRVSKSPNPTNDNTIPAPTGTFSKEDITLTIDGSLDGSTFQVGINGDTPQVATLSFPGTDAPSNLRELAPYLAEAIRKVSPDDPSYAGATVEAIGGRLLVRAGGGKNYDASGIVDINKEGTDTFAEDLKFTGSGKIENLQEYQLGLSSAPTSTALVDPVEGNDGNLPTADELIGSTAPTPKTGMQALRDVDLFNLLCLPRAAGLSSDTKLTSVYEKAIELCEDERAFLVVDMPKTVTTIDKAIGWLEDHASLKSNHAATYFPRIQIPDPLDDYRLRNVGASGTILGLYSRTDTTRGVWKAPAGTEANLAGVSALDLEINDAGNGSLNPLGINALRRFSVYGNVSWGSRTLQGSDQEASEWKYIPIRRLALFIEESLFRGSKWVVFEPNDEPLWAQIRQNIGTFMNNLYRQGAFQGSSPKDAYFVKCDSETTTQADRDLGIVNIQVGFAPLKPAEFVILNILQIVGDQS